MPVFWDVVFDITGFFDADFGFLLQTLNFDSFEIILLFVAVLLV